MIGRLLLGLWLLSAAPKTVARADASPYLGRDNPLAALLPSAAAREARETARHERYIERQLTRIAQVTRAEVLFSRSPGAPVALDQAPPRPQVSVRIEASPGVASDAEIMRIVRDALPELAPDDVHISRSHPRSPARAIGTATARVGPFVVAKESSGPLRATLALCLGANALLAALLLARRRRAR